MEKIKSLFLWLIDKPLVTKILFLIAAVLIASAFLFSCASWKGASVGGTHVVDKNVKDSVYYETNWSK